MSLADDIRSLRRSIEQQSNTGDVDIAGIVSRLRRLEDDAQRAERDADDTERKLRRLKSQPR